jgi:hypothetical protein
VVPGLIDAKGPTDDPSPRRESLTTANVTIAPGPISESTILLCGPTSAPERTTVRPSKNVKGKIVASGSISTLASM